MKARFLTVFALWSFVIIMAMVGVLLAPAGFAQEAKKPFQLQIEKRHVHEEADPAAPPSQGASLRISRDRLGLNALTPTMAPQTAPPLAGRANGSGFNLHAQDFALPGQAEAFTGTPRAGVMAPLPAAASAKGPLKGSVFAKDLANFDIELIVDQSLSMRQRDCPRFVSRWQWCGEQLNDLSTKLTPYAPQGFTLTTFSGFFNTYPHATGAHLQQLFANPQFSPGTRLSLPLQARLDNYFARRTKTSKPLLIVVITDGVPHPRVEPDRVANTLIAATQQVRSQNEVTVVFFQIGGNDRFGRMFLNAMDNELLANGARYDIVRNVSFEQLQAQGLTGSLVSAVRGFAQQAAYK